MPADQSLLEHSLDRILTTSAPELADTIRLVAIPHWFSTEMINAVRKDSTQAAQSLIEELAEFNFVSIDPDGTARYHENIRSLLLEWWHQPQNLPRFRIVSNVLSEHLSRENSISELIHFIQSNREYANNEKSLHIRNVIEVIYHRLVADEPRGLQQLRELYWMLQYANEYAANHLLLSTVREQRPLLSHEGKLWLKYLEARSLIDEKKEVQASEILELLVTNTTNINVHSSVLLDWGYLLTKRGQPLQVEGLYHLALKIADAVSDHHTAARALELLGDVHSDRGLFTDAVSFYEDALELGRQVNDKFQETVQLRKLGGAWLRGHHWQNTRACFLQCLELAKETGNQTEAGWALRDLGLLSADQEHWNEALGWYSQAQSIFEELNQPSNQITILFNIGRVNRSAKRWVEAEKAYRSGLDLSREIGDRVNEAGRLNDLGLLQADQEQWEEALDWYGQALSIFEELNQPSNQITILSNIADVNRSAKKWKEAEEAYRSGLDLSREIGDRVNEAGRLNDLGLLQADQEQWEEALDWYGQALSIFEELNQPSNQITILSNIADVNRSAKKWKEAEEAYRSGLDDVVGDRLQPTKNQLDRLTVDRIPPRAQFPVHSHMPLSANLNFVGRQSSLLQIARTFRTGLNLKDSGVKTIAITGTGGLGKTQLASEFVHRYGQFFAGGIFWVSFADPKSIASEIAACGGVGRLDLRADFADLSLDEQVKLVQTAWQESTPRLLIFDNCEDPELVKRWRPTTGGCCVLITTRRSEWDPHLGIKTLALDVLDRTESLELLRHLYPDASSGTLEAIADELGDLPLALELAGRYLHRYRYEVSPEQYLEQLRTLPPLQHESLHRMLRILPTGHIQNLARTITLSYDQLDE
ncbi:tetratricopeptide repeat protein [Chloroflexi bacterium TSY]|nr:tetratricopeptide repeat protein [Chloroflexi bacterium TSY]